jgi:uncharacterized protein (TIGR03086 family)
MELDQALQCTLAVLAKVRPEDLDGPTPCALWNVAALVNHFVGTARWWAATVCGDGGVIEADYAEGDFVAAYEESIRIAVTAFGADGALARTIRLPFGEFPGTVSSGPVRAGPRGSRRGGTGRPARCLPRPRGVNRAR